jgi:hypothetical protein
MRPLLPVFVVDIDVTIADPSHREGLLVPHCVTCGVPEPEIAACCGEAEMKIPQQCWDDFISADLVALDPPVKEAQRVLNYLFSVNATVLFVTGRNETLRPATIGWLQKHFEIPRSYNFMDLYMRSLTETHTPASAYKRSQVERVVKEHPGCPLVFFEDDPFVQRLYAEYGLVFHGPECWAAMCPPGACPSNETAWRK